MSTDAAPARPAALSAAAARDNLARRRGRAFALLGVGLVLLLLSLLAGVSTGAVAIAPGDVAALLARAVGFDAGADVPERIAGVFWNIRLPRVVLAGLVGASLALAGGGIQGLFRNPLADPGIIGVTTGASVGAVVCILFGWQDLAGGWLLPLMAFGGAVAAVTALRLFSAGFNPSGGPAHLILAGVALNAMLGAVLGFVLFSANDQALRSITFWTLGSCGGATWHQAGVLALALLAGAVLMGRRVRALDAMQLGEVQAAHMGVPVRRVQRETIAAAALVAGAATAFAGSIGFIGLVAPHMARIILGGRHQFVLPGALMLGAMLLILADLGARTWVAPAELSVGIITAGAGGPFFLWLLRSRRQA